MAAPCAVAGPKVPSQRPDLFGNKEKNMPWWVDVAYVVGTVAIFVLFDLFGKWVDKL